MKIAISLMAIGCISVSTLVGCGGSGLTGTTQFAKVKDSLERVGRVRAVMPFHSLPSAIADFRESPTPGYDPTLRLWFVETRSNPTEPTFRIDYFEDAALTKPGGFMTYDESGPNTNRTTTQHWDYSKGQKAGEKTLMNRVDRSDGSRATNWEVSTTKYGDSHKGTDTYNPIAKSTTYAYESTVKGVRVTASGLLNDMSGQTFSRSAFQGQFVEDNGVTVTWNEEQADFGLYTRTFTIAGNDPLLPATGTHDLFGNGTLTLANGNTIPFKIDSNGIRF